MNTETTETIMLQIKETLVSLDLAEQFFCCDIEACKGECCIEGDAGAPVTDAEARRIEAVLPLSLLHISDPTRLTRRAYALV